jgi:translation elongation factor EF-Tu-like GTPase
MKSSELILVKAILKMRTTAEGGRKTGFKSGLRPNHVFEYFEDEILRTWIGDIQFEGQELIMPGEKREVLVRFLDHEEVRKYLQVGIKWWVHEGSTCIGEAEVIEIKLPTTKPIFNLHLPIKRSGN